MVTDKPCRSAVRVSYRFRRRVVGIGELLDQGLDYRLTRQDDNAGVQAVWLAGNEKVGGRRVGV